MSFWDTEDAQDPISELLEKSDLTVVDLFNEGSMLQELRTNNEHLIEYYAKEDVIKELCDWSFTTKFQDNESFDKYSRIATEVFTCASTVSNGFINSPYLKDFFTKQLLSKDDWDPGCAGHFQRVFLHLTNVSKGEYLSRYGNLIPNLIHHISTLAITELVVMLTNQYYSSFCPNGELVTALSDYLITDNADVVSAVYALRQLFNLGWENADIQKDLTSDSLIANLIQASKTSKVRLGQIECMRLLRDISNKNELALIFRRGDVGDVPTADCASSALATSVKGITLEDSLKGAIGTPHWQIANAYLKIITIAAPEDIFEIVKSNNIVSQLAAIPKENLNPFQLEVIRILFKKAEEFQFDLSPLQEVKETADKLWNQYGGPLPIGGAVDVKLNAE
ncbi:hypothetical protein TVAG_369200 [Trichomonas vaginalis G3]|uniref:Uncharacterized protein n=1 Tax=Trichomonas vaginalis (strain ATCC PRA-98 / G3) TaxID=412133 RepID=A2FGE6_TRIV3|nr:serine/threonine-protein phosphatase 6 regulatory subunit family [Trichomonas vaginalis G3]EAX96010.1 hypothetical protein TVAG_369200 [Trichomonas vaginalis G3]KAI5483326.1 serine/threonine-protein phosphatase 6 regulatory subunit family [Trichomonas vaginalis G3]|eukprot:XP_001308940.1 hypothetical protein [Trichomonas vaginalis G3]